MTADAVGTARRTVDALDAAPGASPVVPVDWKVNAVMVAEVVVSAGLELADFRRREVVGA